MTIVALISIIEMKRKDLSIKTYRDYLEESAERGNKEAIEAIKELDEEGRYYELYPYDKVIGVNVRRKIWKKKKEEQIHTEQTQ